LCLSACGSKITKENFNKVKQGMSEKEVEGILGSPNQQTGFGPAKTSIWKDDKAVIVVFFKESKVVGTPLWMGAGDMTIGGPQGAGFNPTAKP
jgi:hypothetical protein